MRTTVKAMTSGRRPIEQGNCLELTVTRIHYGLARRLESGRSSRTPRTKAEDAGPADGEVELVSRGRAARRGAGFERVQAAARAEVVRLAPTSLVTAFARSTVIPHTGSVAPRRAVSQNRAAKIASPMTLSDELVVDCDRAEDVGARGPRAGRDQPSALNTPSTIRAARTIVTNISAAIRTANRVP